jgi:hypothetical protein
VDSVTSDEPDGHGEFMGIVKYGNPVSADTVAHDLSESIDTAKVNLRRLSNEGYVIRKRIVGAGYSYQVVNSKKWCWKRSNGHQVENPSMEKPADDRVENPLQVENPSMGNLLDLGKKPADDRRETYSNNKEEKTLLRHRKRSSSPDGADDHHDENIDPRHATVRTVILDLHLKKFRVTCEWNGREGKALNELLAANPTWTEAQIRVMVQNRFQSDGVTSSRPGKWISALGAIPQVPWTNSTR